ncbi:MAG TPA: hypothetical protein VIG38_08320 [Hyphomicrobium sp.]|jgi:hypothetical protein
MRSALIRSAVGERGLRSWGVGMVDGFHWTRVTSKQLRFRYEEVTTLPPSPQMRELVAAIDRNLDEAVVHSRQMDAPEKATEASAGPGAYPPGA